MNERMIIIENKKILKDFDPTVCFTFFGSWVKSIEALESEDDKKSMAYRLFKSIAEYSMYDVDPDFSDNITLNALWSVIEREIDTSVGNRKKGFAEDKINEKVQTIINAAVQNPGASLRKLADISGINKDTVRRIKKKYEEEINAAIVDTYAVSNDVTEEVTAEETGEMEEDMLKESPEEARKKIEETTNEVTEEIKREETKKVTKDDMWWSDIEETIKTGNDVERSVALARERYERDSRDSYSVEGADLYADAGDYIDTSTVVDSDLDSDTDYDSMRQDTDDTERQYPLPF